MRFTRPLLILATLQILYGQTDSLHFEVASVRMTEAKSNADRSEFTGGPGTRSPELVRARNQPLRYFIEVAYAVELDQIEGPTWINTQRYDIAAKVPANATKEQFRIMLQELLAERFQVVLHHAMRIKPIYQLVLAPGGHKLKPSTSLVSMTNQVTTGNHLRLQSNESFDVFVARLRTFLSLSILTGGQTIPATTTRIADETGITGRYEIVLEYSRSTPSGAGDEVGDRPDFFTALREQLGLRMVEAKISVDTIVVDSANRIPTDN